MDVPRAGWKVRAGLAAGLLVAALVDLTLVGPAAAAEPPRVQIIFDGSGSMWGQIPGDSGAKFNITREALRQALPSVSRTAELGLVLFGHRRRGDCTDVEQAVPLGAGEPARLLSALEALNPKGRGPLALAMVSAADALPGTGASESIVLIHDDFDNCQGDPCAAAAELRRVRPRLAIHVVSIGSKPEDAERMACVPRITGGRHFEATNAAAVAPALAEALRLASLEAPGTHVAVPRPREVTRDDRGPPGLRLSAVLVEGGEPLDQPVTWRVFRGDNASAAPVAEITEAAPSVPLPPGPYVVEAARDLVRKRQAVEVGAGRPTRATVALDAGIIELSAGPFGASETSPTAVISLESREDGASGAGRALWLGPAAERDLLVPAGTYRVALQDRQFRAERIIVVPGGSKGKPPLGAGAGRISLEARDDVQATDPAEGVLFQVIEDDPSAPGGRREVARSAAPRPHFTLPAGTYHLVARKGLAETRELIALRPGDDVSRTLVLKLARLSLTTRLPGASEPVAAKAMAYRVYRLDGTGEVRARAGHSAARLELPAGRYRVEARVGRLNAIATREIELSEAGEQSIELEPAAALIQLRLALPGGGHAGGDVFWEVRDSSGQVVWRSTEPEPREFLAAGRYSVRAETRERRKEQSVELTAGEQRTLDVAFE